MIDLSGRVVRFYLSVEGRRALKGLVPARGSFQAAVLTTSDLGALIWKSEAGLRRESKKAGPVMLLRLDYIATMSFDYRQPEEAIRDSIGFRSPSGIRGRRA